MTDRMSDKPIIFSGAMVRALLDGRKTMTRRLLGWEGVRAAEFHGGSVWSFTPEVLDAPMKCKVPPYAVGDRLYVRETFYETDKLTRFGVIDGAPVPAVFRADWPENEWRFAKWTPPIHMPKDYSRITLTVTAVKVERLQDISEADATAEGIMWDYMRDPLASGPGACRYFTPAIDTPTALKGFNTAAGAFRALWDSLNAKRAPWDSNPWVVAPSFTVEKINIERMPA